MQMLAGMLMPLHLQQVVQLAHNLMGFLLIRTTPSMWLIEQMVEFRFGLMIVLIQQEQFPVVCRIHMLFS